MFCPKCGNSLPGNAAFCRKCGCQLGRPENVSAYQGTVAAAHAAMSASSKGARFSLPIARLLLGVALLLLAFAPLFGEAYTYTGMITGTSSNSASYNLFALGKGLFAVPYIAAVALAVLGAAIETAKGSAVGRWMGFFGFLFVVGCIAFLVVSFSAANPGEYANAYVAQASHTFSVAWGCWAIIGLSAVGAITCFFKRA